LTTGTIFNQNYNPNYLLAIRELSVDKKYGICFIDASTGTFSLGFIEDDFNRTNFETLIQTISPKEVVFEKGNLSKTTLTILKEVKPSFVPRRESKEISTVEDIINTINSSGYFKSEWPEALKNYIKNELVMLSVGLLMDYLREIKLDKELFSMENFQNYNLKNSSLMVLDGQTLINLGISYK
jgi:DNA mismatch repair protein MSH6